MHISPSTKNAIKVALSVVLAICLALWLQWDKPYWSVISIIAMAANETYGHAFRKGQNRVLGTLLGMGYAIFLIGCFSQDPLLFISFYTLFLAYCVFMASNQRYGYMFTIAFVVCAIIASIGGFDSTNTFNIAALRIQETLLGVVVYSIVFRLVWPQETESHFFSTLKQVVTKLNTSYSALLNNESLDLTINDNVQTQIYKLQELLSLPLTGSHQLQHQHKQWRFLVGVCQRVQAHVDYLDQQKEAFEGNNAADVEKALCTLATVLPLLDKAIANDRNSHKRLRLFMQEHAVELKVPLAISSPRLSKPIEQPILTQATKARLRNALKAVCILLTCFALWIFIPLPGGAIFPMLASVFANVIVTMPDSIVKQAFWGTLGWGAVILLQYTFIMPSFTELWQLAGFYGINFIIIWKLCESPSLGIQKVLGGNLLVVLTMSALQATPSYGIETPLLMLVNVMICMAVIRFYTGLFSSPQNKKNG
ncbi:FUSC family protein [Photobacterium kagoshimensis]|uniref:FUSC family protein n=1 Tax=Photobacterium kagoshimensis TaxID=2910242 RepID=UPI003D1355F8